MLVPDGSGLAAIQGEVAVHSEIRAAGPEPCAEDALFSQRSAGADDDILSAIYADQELGQVRFDKFWDVRGDISGLSWYGVFMDKEFFEGCGSEPREFEIRFYDDANDAPGTEVAYYAATLTGEPTELDIGYLTFATKYTLTIDPPLTMQEGWVSIGGGGAPDGCVFMWISDPYTDPPGDGRHCFSIMGGDIECQVPGEFWSTDLNMCILGTFYPGACCDDLSGVCQDGIEYEDCLPPARFEPGVFCNELDPPCGQITGACCEGAICQTRTPAECQIAGGVYKGDYVPCDPNPCVGACCLGDYVCEVYTEVECLGLNGDYHGDGTSCVPNPCPPPNDDCANAEAIGEGTLNFDVTYATLDGPQACSVGQNVWYCYTPSATGTVKVTTSQSGEEWWEPSSAAYEGCACDPSPSAVACDSNLVGWIEFDVRAGAQYLIEVGPYSYQGDPADGGQGTIVIELTGWAYGACCTDTSPYCYETYEPLCEGAFGGAGTTCGEDCNNNGSADACDIALEVSADCNENGIPDECDVAAGTSADYDQDGVPDECDPDCNENGIPDACDIDCTIGDCASIVGCGGSDDCQLDGIPDGCQLGGGGDDEVLLWDNGAPGYEDPFYRTLESQEGASASSAFVVDDFYLSEAATVTTFHAHFEDEAVFNWTGRVRIEVYPDTGMGAPDETGGPAVLIWVPDDGGGVTRTLTATGDFADSYRYDVTDINIDLGAGIWWIGMASEADSMFGTAGWATSRATGYVELGEAHFRRPSWDIVNFIPASSLWQIVPYDVSFSVGTTISGADCNENLIPDDCDIAHCDGSLWCQDCNANSMPDGCETDCNGNGIPDDCDIRDCDGSPWCLDCQSNGVPDGCEPDCNANNVADECDIMFCDGSLWCLDCNESGVPDSCDIASGNSTDHDLNRIPDECDPDCNENGIPDVCDLDCTAGDCVSVAGCGGSQDCQPDGIPDDCQLFYEMEYLTDDGTADDSVGMLDGGTFGWLTHFTVAPGFEDVDAISLAWGSVLDGTPCTVYVWSDPDGNGDPTDAQVLTSAATAVANPETGTFTIVDVPDVYIGRAGTSFFVGAMVNHQFGEFPAALDRDASQGQSWMFGDVGGMVDPNELGGGSYAVTSVDYSYPGNWLLRAIGFNNNDCDGNGIPDDCDIAADPSLDCNGNLAIDACEWADCNDNGVLDDCDILDCDGSPWCSDCNGNHVPDECDIVAGAADCQPNGIPDECEEDCNGNGIADDCDIRDCDGSVWCDDCNANGIVDECDAGQPGGITYQYDDGTSETSIGIRDSVEIAWIQSFTAEPGSETIIAVATCFGNQYQAPVDTGVYDGDTVRVFVWDDPDSDGEPYDAVLLASADGTIDGASIRTDVLQEFAIGPVAVSGGFFVGAAVVVSSAYPTPLSTDNPMHKSWSSYELTMYGGFNPNMFFVDNVDDIGYPGNWLLRAVSEANAAANDCNLNGIPDDCELCGDLDADGDVDYDDYVIFLEAFGGVTDGVPAVDYCCDYDGSGAVGMVDFDAWLACYRAYVNDPLAGPPTIGKRRIRVPLGPLPKQGLGPVPSP